MELKGPLQPLPYLNIETWGVLYYTVISLKDTRKEDRYRGQSKSSLLYTLYCGISYTVKTKVCHSYHKSMKVIHRAMV